MFQETTEDIEVESEEEGTDGEKVKETKTQKVVTVTLTKTQSENTEMLNQKISNLSSKASAIETNTPAAGADVEKYKTFYNAQKMELLY